MKLQALLQDARERTLTEAEIAELTELAEQSPESVQEAIGVLVAGGPTAAVNLRAAAKLRLVYSASRKRPKSIPQTPKRKKSQLKRSERKLIFSTHAVERFAERWAPGQTDSKVRRILWKLAQNAVLLRAKTVGGQERWMTDVGAILIVKRDKGVSIPTCVTVLPAEASQR